jgi:hypothetical protein
VRSAYTGETPKIAGRAVGRHRTAAIDLCTPKQVRLRALLGKLMFNSGEGAAPFGSSSVAAVTMYNFVVSPQFNDLRIIASAPTNVTGRLLGRGCNPSERKGVPGLRLTGASPGAPSVQRCTYQLAHLPTGATVTVTERFAEFTPTGHDDLDTLTHAHNWPMHDAPLTPTEQEWLDGVPQSSGDADRLFAAVVVRLNLRDPKGTWAIGNWFSDPLGEPLRQPVFHNLGLPDRSLQGSGEHWTLTWDGYPYVDDLVYALTDPVVGLAGLTVEPAGLEVVLRLGTARLKLAHRPSPPSQRSRISPGSSRY